MPSDSELRDRFHEGTQPRGEIDVDAVLRRARARRRPRVALTAAGSMLVIAAIAVPAAVSSYTSGSGAAGGTALVAGDAAPEFASGGDAGGSTLPQSQAVPAEKLNLCTAPLAEVAPAENGLVISAGPIVAAAGDRHIPVTVTLTNTGDRQIFGTTGTEPALTLSRDGVTVWHTNGAHDAMARIVDLGPGESMTYAATFEPVVCGVDDEALESFRANLPAAPAGTYQLSAAIDVTHNDGLYIDLVTGPAAEVRLR